MSLKRGFQWIILIGCLSCVSLPQAQARNDFPHPARQGFATQLVVDGLIDDTRQHNLRLVLL